LTNQAGEQHQHLAVDPHPSSHLHQCLWTVSHRRTVW